MELWLKTRGYTALTANSAAQAQQLATEHLPRVVIADLGLPDRSGHSLLKTLKRVDALRQSHFVAFSGDTDGRERESALQAGFNCFVCKPPDFDELSRILESCLGPETDDAGAAVT